LLSPRTARFSLPAGAFLLFLLSSQKKQNSPFSHRSLDKDLIVFSRATGKNIAKLKGHAKRVTSVLSSTSLTSDDVPSFLVSSSLDKTVRVWTPNGSKQVYGASSTISLDGEATQVALHPSNTLAAAASTDGTWSLIDLNAEKAAVVLSGGLPEGLTTSLTSIAFHPDGALFAAGSADGKIYIFDILAGGKCAITLSSETATGAITSISFSENGYILASASSGSQSVSIWDLRKGVSTHTIALEGADESATVSAVAFDYSNQFLAVVGSDARVYQFKTWELLAKSDENAAELTGVAWGKDSKEVVVVGLDRTARVLAAPASE
jgi:pre-mRNA-processing factor 19